MKILLVEDDAMIGESIQSALEGEGFSLDWARDGSVAEERLAANIYDAVLLDLGLPKKDGIDILQGMRAGRKNMPVMVITARETVDQRVQGLNAGADDYLVKPFSLKELIARLHALIRRAQGRPDPIYQSGGVIVNPVTREVLVAGRPVILSAREWTILEALIARPGAVFSRTQLEERLYGMVGDFGSNAVEVFIHGLRKKLGPDFISNIRGVGYMVEKT